MDYRNIGFVRVGIVAPRVHLANPAANALIIQESYAELVDQGCALVLTPELSLTGYSCEDLFCNQQLLDDAKSALLQLVDQTEDCSLIIGFPLEVPGTNQFFNCAIVCANQSILGAVPKSAIPNHGEYYEQRWFTSGKDVDFSCTLGKHSFQLTTNQLFSIGDYGKFGIEICEDLWMPASPSIQQTTAGAEIICNLSASSEWIGKVDYRHALVRVQSVKHICAYLYASAGVFESTKDTVFGGHLVGYENGELLGESNRFETETSHLIVDVDVDRLRFERKRSSTFPANHLMNPLIVKAGQGDQLSRTIRSVNPNPFVPAKLDETCDTAPEVLKIQTAGLLRRMNSIGCEKLIIGLSGGLDSTLALLACLSALEQANQSLSALVAVTMPGHGTSSHTRETVQQLVDATEIQLKELDICDAVDAHLQMIGHNGAPDVTFENAQARERSKILFNLANQYNGIVIGTGDLTELALGWCTFNADHMSSYNVNVGIPKTLIRYVVRWYALHRANDQLREVLLRVLDTPISPELLRTESEELTQKTESILGPLEIHDFFLYHFLKTGATIHKLFLLAEIAFSGRYDKSQIKQCLTTFVDRFFNNQFKRSTVPPGPKVGEISLSPRSDWRLPDEIAVNHWKQEIHEY
ncbi:MAG: NAD(+) synthase [Gammaproteobacteria bacterium]|nr:NAD(+) synthase [Gammaproteobacteria bacterium]